MTSGDIALVTLRRIGDEDLPKNLRIIVAGNDKGNVTALDDASVSRFTIINVAPDASTLIEVLGQNLHPWVKTVLEKHPETVFVKNTNEQAVADGQDDDDDDNATVSVFDLFDGTEEIRPFATPRTIDGRLSVPGRPVVRRGCQSHGYSVDDPRRSTCLLSSGGHRRYDRQHLVHHLADGRHQR